MCTNKIDNFSAHPRTRLFITHAGYNSILEGAESGVPMLFTPLFGDQPPNARRAERMGCGLSLNIKTEELTSEEIVQTVRALTEQPKWAKNARKLAKELADQPASSSEQLSQTIDQLVRFPDRFVALREGQALGEVAYLGIDLLLAKLALLIVAFSVLA